MKKGLIASALMLLVLPLVGCSYQNKILNVKVEEERGIVCERGYIESKKKVDFTELVRKTLRKDKKDYNDEKALLSLYFEGKMFFSYEYSQNDQIIGYINIDDFSVTYTYFNYEKNFDQSIFYPVAADENSCLFIEYIDTTKKNYAAFYDFNNNEMINEKASDDDKEYEDYIRKYNNYIVKNRYECNVDGKTYSLRSLNDNVRIQDEAGNVVSTIDYNYILQRSEKMKEIDAIVKNEKIIPRLTIYTANNEIFIDVRSRTTSSVEGVLIPVVFKYNMSSDKFTYIGAAPYGDVVDII